MGAFLGCCVIAGMIWYVGRKIGRVLFLMCSFIEMIGKRSVTNWPTSAEWDELFKG